MDFTDATPRSWAEETFGGAELGDQRRTARLVAMAARAAQQPGGTVTSVFTTSADREGAFRLLENPAVSPASVADAAMQATARRCAGDSLTYVAVDGATLTLSDRAMKRELGMVGGRFDARGLHMMNALAVDSRGTTVGLVDQQWWTRKARLNGEKRKHRDCRGVRYQEKETRFWLQSIVAAEQRMASHSPRGTRWYQFDRGADCWPLFKYATEQKLLVTVRAAQNRRVTLSSGRASMLYNVIRRQPVLGHYELDLPRRGDRPARRARMSIRACTVAISVRVRRRYRIEIQLNVVAAQEEGRASDRLSWTLLTTAPVGTFEQARAVVNGYTLRWRVEEFHRAWKKGLCNVEDSQLHSQHTLIKWATILGTVAARAIRLAQLARTAPESLSSDEFTEYEIEAAFVLLKRQRDRDQQLTLSEVVGLVAEIGGYAHKYAKHRRPGATVIGRGLERIQILAQGLQNLDEMR